METEPQDGVSLTVPLMHNENLHDPTDVEASIGDQTTSKTSFFKSCFNGLNALSGVGILSVPYAVSLGGWLSLILLFVIAIAAFYSGLLIQRCMDMDSDIRTYPDIGNQAFGNKGKILVSVFMNMELFLVATEFLILEGDTLSYLFPNTEFEIMGVEIEGKQVFIIIVALVILPSVCLDNLSLLSYISASGVFASIIILGSVLWTGAFDGIGFHQEGRLINWNGITTAASLYAFCYCAHPVFPTMYTSMRSKSQFSNSQITFNLPTEKLSLRVAICTTLVNPIAKYALMVTPVVNAIKSWFPYQYNKKMFGLLISTSLVISTVIVALVVPIFATLMSLVGAFLSATVSIILPCLCYLKISGTYKRFGYEMVVIWCIILMGVALAITGTYTSLVQIIGDL
uniref:Amino acid transporter transmembrane domain-containing protein n=1 Tax=Fagus sylvatica TaxID=28930 RepID=A0A2N9ER79_FAGSY